MNQNPHFHVVLDLDGTTPPITVASGAESEYYDAIRSRLPLLYMLYMLRNFTMMILRVCFQTGQGSFHASAMGVGVHIMLPPFVCMFEEVYISCHARNFCMHDASQT